jgi:MFS family permease
MTETPKAAGAFAPLRQPVFAVLWAATVLGNIGSFMRDVASSWLVTDLSASPTAVALIQTAATLPIFLLAIPAGVLSDILDRRRFLIYVQVLLAAVSGTLLVLSHTGSLTVEYLVALTFVGGIGAALMGPTWQSIVPELVPRSDLKSAVALNSLGINIARSIGPAAGGLILASFGAAATYGLDVLSYVFVIAALLWWKRPAAVDSGLSENFLGAFRAGIRYTRASKELHVVLLRAAVFFLFASSVWALLPLVARQMLGGSAGFYGILLGAVGAGAIGGALVMPRLRARLDADGMLLLASLLTAAVMGGLSSRRRNGSRCRCWGCWAWAGSSRSPRSTGWRSRSCRTGCAGAGWPCTSRCSTGPWRPAAWAGAWWRSRSACRPRWWRARWVWW